MDRGIEGKGLLIKKEIKEKSKGTGSSQQDRDSERADADAIMSQMKNIYNHDKKQNSYFKSNLNLKGSIEPHSRNQFNILNSRKFKHDQSLIVVRPKKTGAINCKKSSQQSEKVNIVVKPSVSSEFERENSALSSLNRSKDF